MKQVCARITREIAREDTEASEENFELSLLIKQKKRSRRVKLTSPEREREKAGKSVP